MGIRSSDSSVPRSTFVPGRQSRKSRKRDWGGLIFMAVCATLSPAGGKRGKGISVTLFNHEIVLPIMNKFS